jgi:2,4-dienoyl-CoA reductase-like NADH-dependent reductase (Old Yellow Enzyme family)
MVPLKKIVDAAHEHGSRIFLQLVMNGKEFEHKGGINGLVIEELEEIRDSFIASAKLCKETGFDGIELHGAHELFLNQVSSDFTNHRTDRYGGDKDGRLALAKEIISGIKTFADENFIVSYRMGATFDLEKDVKTAKTLVDAGLDMLHVSYGITDVRQIHIPQEFAEYDEIVYAGCHIKHHVNVPTIVVSNINTLQRGEKLLGHGDCDFVAYGRTFLRDPAFVIHQIGQEDLFR